MTDETTTNRWTAKVELCGGLGAIIRFYNRRVKAAGVLHLTPADAESLAEQINRPAPTAPADDLPPGVERISDGTLWLRVGAPVPDDWEWRYSEVLGTPGRFTGWTIDASNDRGIRMVQVRPVTPPEPDTEWVPLWEALRDHRKIRANSATWIACEAVRTVDGRMLVGTTGVGWDTVRPDGMVEVQR